MMDMFGQISQSRGHRPNDAYFSEEGRKILAESNLTIEEVESGKESYGRHYMDPVWRHPDTGAKIFVGNSSAASVKNILLNQSVFDVVNCTTDLPNYHQNDPKFTYYTFPISNWERRWEIHLDEFSAFLVPLFLFVHERLIQGKSVLIHCLAGAHRAGTTGVMMVMFFANKNFNDALRAATMIRPIIHPFAHLKTLALLFDKNHERVRSDFEEQILKKGLKGDGEKEEKEEKEEEKEKKEEEESL